LSQTPFTTWTLRAIKSSSRFQTQHPVRKHQTQPLTAMALANVTQITYTNLSSRNVTTTSSTQTGGTYKLVLSDITLTSTGGSTGPFRYVYLFNDTVTAPADPLVGYYDYGSSLTLNDGDSLTVDFSAANGVLQIA